MVLYQNNNVLAVCKDGTSLDLCEIKDLSVIKTLNDNLNLKINKLNIGPSKRILIVEEDNSMTIYDAFSGVKAYQLDVFNSIVDYMT